MAENQGDKEDKFDQFTAAGEILGYITLEQARILAIQHARDNTDFYGPRYARVTLVWEVTSQEAGEDFYDIRLSFRPAGRFRGDPGIEQLIIDKTGNIQLRQILDEPSDLGQPAGRRLRWMLPTAVGVVVAGVVGVVGLVASGTLAGGGSNPTPTTPPIGAAISTTQSPTPVPDTAATLVEERPAPTPLVVERQVAVTPTPAPTPTPAVVEREVVREVQVVVTPTPAPLATAAPAAIPVAAPQPVPAATGEIGAGTRLNSSGYSFKLSYACIELTLEPCVAAAAEGGFARRVLERTNGQVDIQFTSLPELGVAGPDTLPLLEEGIIAIIEVNSAYVAGKLPVLGIPNLWGLYRDEEMRFAASERIKADLARAIEEISGGVVLGQQFYPNSFIFSRTPIETPEDFNRLRVRTSSTGWSDLIRAMGAEPQIVDFAETYSALERGILDAAVTIPSAAFSQRWYEVADYVVGPIPSLGQSWITINGNIWNEIPPDLQAIMREEAARHEELTRQRALGVWFKDGVTRNLDAGMKWLELSPQVKEFMRQAAIDQMLPNWVRRAGGPGSPAVQVFAQKVAPIVGVRMRPDGTAVSVVPPFASVPTPVPEPTALPATAAQPATPLLTVALAASPWESNRPWTMPLSRLVPLRPMFEHLLDIDRRTGQTIPMLAEKWEMSPDGTEWIFGLRDNVQFHFGYGEFNAKDVFYSMESQTQEDSWPSSAAYWRDILVEVIDERTVAFVLDRPEPELAYQLSAARGLIMLNTVQWASEGADSIESRPAGTGSYQFLERDFQDGIRLERVGNHWRRSPQFGELRIISVAEESTRLALLLTGEGQIVELGREMLDHAEDRGMRRISSQLPARSIVWFMGGQYNSSSDRLDPTVPWLDLRVRMAMNLAIDRALLNEVFYDGRAKPMPVFGFHPSLPGWDPSWQPYPYDPEFAKQLLADAGYPDGFSFKMYLATQRSRVELVDLSEVIATMLSEVGIVPELVETEFARLVDLMRNREMHGAMWGISTSYRPPPESVRIFNYSREEGVVYSYEHLDIDALYERLSQTVDPGRRQAILRVLGDHKYENYADIPLFWLKAEVGVYPDQVRDYVFPGSIPGSFTHLEYVEPAR